MSKLTVGVSAADVPKAGRGRPILQNLGPGNVYFDTDATATVATGIKLEVGDVFEFAEAASLETRLSVISDTADTDVRYVIMGA